MRGKSERAEFDAIFGKVTVAESSTVLVAGGGNPLDDIAVMQMWWRQYGNFFGLE